MGDNERADWQGVGESFRTLGKLLKTHALEAGDAVRTVGAEADGVVAGVTATLKGALAEFDDTTTDPEVRAATKAATARFLDALKVELTGGTETPEGSADSTTAPDAEPAVDEPPKAVEPGE